MRRIKQPGDVPEQTLRRIPLYHQILQDLETAGETQVSSRTLAGFFKIDETQVRKDVAVIGYRGRPKTGFSVPGLRGAIGEFLGINFQSSAILIGAGRLGSALGSYPGLGQYGVTLVGVFDSDRAKAGTPVGTLKVRGMRGLTALTRRLQVGIAILAVPREQAQKVCDRVVELGIQAIWNFAPIQLTVPEDVVVRNENLAVGLAILSHYLKARGGH